MEKTPLIQGLEKQRDEIRTPFHTATLNAFTKEFPKHAEQLDRVLSEIDRQAVDNFSVFESKSGPGMAFSYTTLSLTPDLIKQLGKMEASSENLHEKDSQEQTEGTEKDIDAERQDYFLFTAFSPPPGGSAFTVQDVAIDRFIRLLPRIANSMRNRTTPPKITVHLLGAPTGLGGKVSPEWIEEIKTKGLDGYGPKYAEYIEGTLPDDGGAEKRHVVLQGVSKGAIVAQKTSAVLPERLQKVTQRLLDNPGGEHKSGSLSSWISGAQVLKGMVQETIARSLKDDMMKTLLKEDKKFVEALMERKGMVKDDTREAVRKRAAVWHEGLTLLRGTSMDTESQRSFIRRGINDPLTSSRQRLAGIEQKKAAGVVTPVFTNGKSMEVPFKGSHFFIYNRYKRWAQILDFVNKTNA